MNPSDSIRHARPSVAIVGGGLAGMAAAVAASKHGFHVELFEARGQLGGRAGSFRDPRTGETVDFCRHAAMRCCTSFIDFCRETGIDDAYLTHRQLNFFSPDGRLSAFRANRFLPAPLHLLPAMMRLKFLTLGERLSIVRAMIRLTREKSREDAAIGPWLRDNGQSEPAIERFWSVVLQSALSETVDRASLQAARKVFADGFMASRDACEVLLPTVPQSELFDRRVGDWLQRNNVNVYRKTKVKLIEGDSRAVTSLLLSDGERQAFDFVVLAVPWHRAARLLTAETLVCLPSVAQSRDMPAAPITAVHLWFDRPISPLPHAVLVGRTSQWVFFDRGREPFATAPVNAANSSGRNLASSQYCQVVISASRELLGLSQNEILDIAIKDLAFVWPEADRAALTHFRVVSQRMAVFSPAPGVERLRPPQRTPLSNLLLAGDWTATGWPATMESAVRSGFLAVESMVLALRDIKKTV
jgi:squalene-associated FAD-dependent desaturase